MVRGALDARNLTIRGAMDRYNARPAATGIKRDDIHSTLTTMIRNWLQRTTPFYFVGYAMLAAFGAYFCMYAFRKPFAVGTYEGIPFLGHLLTFKSALIISQVLGYALSKFIGIKVISEMKSRSRPAMLIGLILLAEGALVLFGLVPAPWNAAFLFLNGLPLGMIWGIVFSYLEGRQTSEVLGAGLASSFIVSSGAVKSVGKWLMNECGTSEMWMPAATGALFLLPMLAFTFLLEQIPPPSPTDCQHRTERQPMNGHERRALYRAFAPGLILLVAFYTLLTAYRDLRDNFAAEIWSALGHGKEPIIFTVSEIPIAVLVLVLMGSTMYIRNNHRAVRTYFWLVTAGVVLVGSSTLLFHADLLNGATWMVVVGFGLYVAYVPFNCILFDRMIAAFGKKANAGYLIYVADAFGYLGSVLVLLWKDFAQPKISWLAFFGKTSYGLAIGGSLLMLAAIAYFQKKLVAASN